MILRPRPCRGRALPIELRTRCARLRQGYGRAAFADGWPASGGASARRLVRAENFEISTFGMWNRRSASELSASEWYAGRDLNSHWARSERAASAVGLPAQTGALCRFRTGHLRHTKSALYRLS